MPFLVTQGLRDRETLEVNYPLLNMKSAAGAVNAAAIQLDKDQAGRAGDHL